MIAFVVCLVLGFSIALVWQLLEERAVKNAKTPERAEEIRRKNANAEKALWVSAAALTVVGAALEKHNKSLQQGWDPRQQSAGRSMWEDRTG